MTLMVRTDHFPETMTSWIQEKLNQGEPGRRAVNRHLMEVYRWPLIIYLRGHSAARGRDPEEIVNGFFDDRLSRNSFLSKWVASDKRLRRWLMNGLNFYLKEIRREDEPRQRATDMPEDLATESGDPDRIVDEAFARAIVHRALQCTEQQCAQDGFQQHWDIFLRHFWREASYEEISRECDCTVERAAVMARTAARRFRAMVRQLLRDDGVPEEQIDDEILGLMESLGSHSGRRR